MIALPRPCGLLRPWRRLAMFTLLLINARIVCASLPTEMRVTSRLATPRPRYNAANHSPVASRRLEDGLECDLQLYHDFINSEEGEDIFIMATMCESRIKYIKEARAGNYGPVEQSDLRSAMCSNECLRSDQLHQLAMSRSRCSCAQVSANTCITHDFCLENSARLLCTHLGECGHWNCALEDFMCLRYEWDRYYACGALSLRATLLGVSAIVVAMVMLL